MSTKSENYFRTSVYNSALGGRECLSRIKWQLGRTVNQNIIETVWNIQIDKWDKSEKKKNCIIMNDCKIVFSRFKKNPKQMSRH